MTFGGLTWGASKKDILGKYGEPTDITYFESMKYSKFFYKFDIYIISFDVYDDGWSEDLPGGLRGVDVVIYYI